MEDKKFVNYKVVIKIARSGGVVVELKDRQVYSTYGVGFILIECAVVFCNGDKSDSWCDLIYLGKRGMVVFYVCPHRQRMRRNEEKRLIKERLELVE